jgi:hypothetical protein
MADGLDPLERRVRPLDPVYPSAGPCRSSTWLPDRQGDRGVRADGGGAALEADADGGQRVSEVGGRKRA